MAWLTVYTGDLANTFAMKGLPVREVCAILSHMSKCNRLMLFITLFSLVFQVPAGVFEFCSQTSRDNSRFESQEDITEITEDCHQAEADKNNSTETCVAQHCCIGTGVSAMFQLDGTGPNTNSTFIAYFGNAYPYSRLDSIFHPPKLLL